MEIVFPEPSWTDKLRGEAKKPYLTKLLKAIDEEYKTKPILPHKNNIFNAFWLTPFEQVKVVIIGQDPYPTAGHAHGLAFSTLQTTRPASLRYIFNDIARDLYLVDPKDKEEMKRIFPTNDLTCWAKQGVFLINPVLTVVEGASNSHQDIGWQDFTQEAIRKLWEDDKPKVFLVWGKAADANFYCAREKSTKTLDSDRHLVLRAGHPATGAYGKDLFSGHNHFIKTTDFIYKHYQQILNWRTNDDNN